MAARLDAGEHEKRDDCVLEMSLISAQGLKPPPSDAALRRSPAFYAVAWFSPTAKLRTRTDSLGGTSPTWNDRFLFRVPAAALDPDSSAAVSVEIYAAGAWCLPDTFTGSVRVLLGDLRLHARAAGAPAFTARGVRRSSGRYHGALNLAVAVLVRVPLLAAEALSARPAIAYRDLIGGGSTRILHRRRRYHIRSPSPRKEKRSAVSAAAAEARTPVGESIMASGEAEEELDGAGHLCRLRFAKVT